MTLASNVVYEFCVVAMLLLLPKFIPLTVWETIKGKRLNIPIFCK